MGIDVLIPVPIVINHDGERVKSDAILRSRHTAPSDFFSGRSLGS